MAYWQINIRGKNIRKATIEKMAEKFKDDLGEGATILVTDATPPETRPERFHVAIGNIDDVRSEIESLRDELQDWYDGMPENFQSGDKGDQLQTAIDELETLSSNLEDAAGTEVEFPGMMG